MDCILPVNINRQSTTKSMLGLELHEAAASGDYDSLEELLRSGKLDVNLGDEDWGEKTALHWSCQKGFVECSRLLIENGAKGTARTLSGYTPAHFAAEAGRLAVLRALHALNIPTDLPDNYGARPSRIAEIYDHQDSMRFLKQAEIELAERRERFELIDLSDGEQEQNRPRSTKPDDPDNKVMEHEEKEQKNRKPLRDKTPTNKRRKSSTVKR